MRTLLISFIAFGLIACSPKSNIEPPAELESFEPRAKLRLLWQANTSYAFNRSRIKLSPLIRGDKLFTAEIHKSVSALSIKTGKTLWKQYLPKKLMAGVGGNEQLLFVASADGDIYALRQDTGELAWTRQVTTEVVAPPTASATLLVVRSIDSAVTAFDPTTGKEKWRYTHNTPTLTLRGTSTPVIIGGGVLVGFDDGRLVALRENDGKLFWETTISPPRGRSEIERLNDIDAEILTTNDAIYVASYQGKLSRLSPSRGRALWSQDISTHAGFSIQENMLYVTNENSEILAIDTQSGRILWKQDKLRARLMTAPVSIDAFLALGDLQGYLHLLSRSDGAIAGRAKVSDLPFLTRPLVQDNRIYLFDRDGVLFVYEVKFTDD
ncbi:MAG: outer membrane protein assembly factor BamB [Gammaproteobacteria bacterium]|nr:outer membrane protein assembly factor BamB [Gammaproteobacteria bacterium]